MGSPRIWFVTGVGRGLGWHIAHHALEAGDVVVGTIRDKRRTKELAPKSKGQLLLLQADVMRPSDVAYAVKQSLRQFGRVDVLVNSAGFGLLGAVEENTEKEIHDQFDVNFFGPVNLIRAFLPQMRKQRSGRIINVTSISGLVGLAATGAYCASKFALDGLSEALAKEVDPLGIKVTIIAPGPMRTDWAGSSMIRSTAHIPDYDATVGPRKQTINNISGKQPGDPSLVARAIFDVSKMESPPIRVVFGRSAVALFGDKLQKQKDQLDAQRDWGVSTDFAE